MRELNIADLVAIAEDMRNDKSKFEGCVVAGKDVGEYFGKQCRAIETIADILKTILKETS